MLCELFLADSGAQILGAYLSCYLAVSADAARPDDRVSGEYCLSESFNASCRGVSEVIVMTDAEYGRMRSGRCVQMKYGQPGCRTDVLSRLDAQCSGRPACSFPVARLLQAGISPCDDELKPYLYASYRCVTGGWAGEYTTNIGLCDINLRNALIFIAVGHKTR